jgi:tripartite-type tricarboxylate transporter receptor subunit TctC
MSQIDRWARAGFVVVAGLMLSGAAAAAENSVAEFYRGKQVRMVIGQAPGGGIDLLIRTVTRHLGKHIPGNPTLIPQNMEGAGSRIAANWLYNVAPQDGTVLGHVSNGVPLDQARKEQGVQFDVGKFNWVGNPLVANGVVVAWTASGITSLDKVKASGRLICGGSAASSPSVIWPAMVKNLTGADVLIITGYPGNNDSMLAMERGELNCMGGTNMSSLKALFPQHLKEHTVSILVQFGSEKEEEIESYAGADVPLIQAFAKTDLDRSALNLINSGIVFGRPILAPPGVPQDRLTALRAAFDATMKDPEFLADAANQRLDINPTTGMKLQQLAAEVAEATDEVVARSNEILAVGNLAPRK